MPVTFIIDSTTSLPQQPKNCKVVPLTVLFGTDAYLDGVTIDHRRFYEMLIESDVLPTTSQPSPEHFARVYEEALSRGDEVLVLTIASGLSGTFQSASIAAMDFPEGKIHVVDSKNVAIGTGILAQTALNLLENGCSAAETAAFLEKERENIRLVALLDTLEYLKKGGRISKTAAFAGGLLNIKPVVCVQEGAIQLLGKARGSRQGNNLLVQEIEKAGGVDFEKPVLLGYTGLGDELLQKYVEDSRHLWQGAMDDLTVCPIGSVIGTHAGPGAVAVAFFKKS